MSGVVSMFNSMSLTPQAQILLEQAVADIATQCGGTQAFFANNNALHDYTTDATLLGHLFHVLTKPNKQQNSRAEPVWPQAEDTLTMPAGIITFSNDDI